MTGERAHEWEVLTDAHDALLRERDGLRERVNDLEDALQLHVRRTCPCRACRKGRAVLSRPATDKEPGA